MSKVELLLEQAETTANMLRGMTLDPAIPEPAKAAMRDRIQKLESATEAVLREMGLARGAEREAPASHNPRDHGFPMEET